LIPREFLQSEAVELDNASDPSLPPTIDTMTEVVKQELLRRAENPKMSLEAYLSSVIVRKDAMDAALELGELPLS